MEKHTIKPVKLDNQNQKKFQEIIFSLKQLNLDAPQGCQLLHHQRFVVFGAKAAYYKHTLEFIIEIMVSQQKNEELFVLVTKYNADLQIFKQAFKKIIEENIPMNKNRLITLLNNKSIKFQYRLVFHSFLFGFLQKEFTDRIAACKKIKNKENYRFVGEEILSQLILPQEQFKIQVVKLERN